MSEPRYFDIPIRFEPWEGSPQPVFREKTKTPFSAEEVRQEGVADGSERQAHFERQLKQISEVMPDGRIPVFSRWQDGVKRRVDLGCVGHALARNVILPPEDDRFLKYVTHIQLNPGWQAPAEGESVG
ncbi:hypothetical protein [Novosphingobium sp.]|uniref:hypothetical protein n=1 Tax=Novosphingobium sp. TaxID=1874826 RepID=UPI001D61AAAF|nr:hypothetical protein [Novosphingobium sp.]MBX9663319.1 hypothetical protein [Novosphingobium sp.]